MRFTEPSAIIASEFQREKNVYAILPPAASGGRAAGRDGLAQRPARKLLFPVRHLLFCARYRAHFAARLVILDELKTKAAHRNIPLPVCLADCLKETKANSQSEYVVPNREGDPLSYTQFKRLWQYIVTRTVKERFYYRYEDGKRVKHTVTPVLGEKAAHNGKVIYSLDFEVTPHQLRHTYITNLIHSSVDPKTVQYLAGHESSKITMDIYAKVKYNRPDDLVKAMGCAFDLWDAV